MREQKEADESKYKTVKEFLDPHDIKVFAGEKALEEAAVSSAGQKAHVIRCPRCRQTIRIPMDQIIHALPAGWTPAAQDQPAAASEQSAEPAAVAAIQPESDTKPDLDPEAAPASERSLRRHRHSSKTHLGDSVAVPAATMKFSFRLLPVVAPLNATVPAFSEPLTVTFSVPAFDVGAVNVTAHAAIGTKQDLPFFPRLTVSLGSRRRKMAVCETARSRGQADESLRERRDRCSDRSSDCSP